MDPNAIAYETMLAAKEAARWACWSMLGTWISGLATVAAVVTSLILANRKPKASVACKIIKTFAFAQSIEGMSDMSSAILIKVVNQSLHSFKINKVGWALGDRHLITQIFKDPGSDLPPIRVEHGEEAKFYIWRKDGEDDWVYRMAVRLKKVNVKPRRLRCHIFLSTGETFSFSLDKKIITDIEILLSRLES